MENKLKKIAEETIKNINTLSDSSNIIGKPISVADGSTIIPISKAIIGLVSGGGEYGEIKKIKKGKVYPLSLASGAVVSLKPCGFLILNGNKTKLIKTETDIYDKFLDKIEGYINEIYKENDDNN